jgi:hypothetical protein
VHESLPAEDKDSLLVKQGQRPCLQVRIRQVLAIDYDFGALHFDAVILLLVQRQLDLLMATIIFADWSRRS